MGKIFTFSIIGVGARGGEAYGRYINTLKDKFKITDLCDVNPERLTKYGELFGVPENRRFSSDTEFFKEKRSDIILISTLDSLHVKMAKKAISLGYDVLLEKPISANVDELNELLDMAEKSGRKIVVCHVLRYTVMVQKLKELLDSGAIGKVVFIDHTENVGFWHGAHSYVRGNWRNTDVSAPMIMAKCCHDLDLLQYFSKSRCKSLSSYGSLAFFKKENKPEGAADRCTECKYIKSCPYSAERIYIDMWKNDEKMPENLWPFNVITDELPLTENKLFDAIKTGPYGRCVFECDNNVVDNQVVMMEFENGINAVLKMEVFAKYGGRYIRFCGSLGELILDESKGIIELKQFFGKDTVWKLNELTDNLTGHGGGDNRMIDNLYNVLNGDTSADTSLGNSIESHLMAIASEKSRLNDGIKVNMNDLRKKNN